MKRNNVIIAVVVALIVVAGIVLAVRHSSSKTASTDSPAASATVNAAASPATSATGSASATNVAVVGGTNGASCDSGGYFKPSAVTISSGGTVTFSVPANDPYSGGLQINGLPGGAITIPRGGSMTTSAITSNVSFNGTWPDETACKKGSGTITVQ